MNCGFSGIIQAHLVVLDTLKNPFNCSYACCPGGHSPETEANKTVKTVKMPNHYIVPRHAIELLVLKQTCHILLRFVYIVSHIYIYISTFLYIFIDIKRCAHNNLNILHKQVFLIRYTLNHHNDVIYIYIYIHT